MYSAIIVAAGQGERTGLKMNKVLYPLHHKPVILYAIEAFKADKDCTEIIVVCKEENQEDILKISNDLVHKYVLGGKTRQESVYNGITEAKEKYVIIHDGARPYLPKTLLANIKKAMVKYGAVTSAIPITDTVKRTYLNKITEDINRENLVAIQTPQAFEKSQLIKAYQMSKKTYTCDASLVQEVLKLDVAIVIGDKKNIKFTSFEDIELLELILHDSYRA